VFVVVVSAKVVLSVAFRSGLRVDWKRAVGLTAPLPGVLAEARPRMVSARVETVVEERPALVLLPEDDDASVKARAVRWRPAKQNIQRNETTRTEEGGDDDDGIQFFWVPWYLLVVVTS